MINQDSNILLSVFIKGGSDILIKMELFKGKKIKRKRSEISIFSS
jgi:hypothetical protein